MTYIRIRDLTRLPRNGTKIYKRSRADPLTEAQGGFVSDGVEVRFFFSSVSVSDPITMADLRRFHKDWVVLREYNIHRLIA